MEAGREMGEGQSAPSAGNSAALFAARRAKIASVKVQENAEGSASSKPNLTRDSDALLTLLREIIHGDPDSSGIYSPCCGKGPVQARFAKYLTQYNHTLTLNQKEPSSGNLSNWINCGLPVAEEEAKNRGENVGRRSAAITDLARTWYELVEH
jgi:hypothetical protein